MASEAAIAAPIASPISSLKYGKCHFSGDSTTPSSDTISDAITFLIGASSDSMSRPTFGRLSIPVPQSFASANFLERRYWVLRRITRVKVLFQKRAFSVHIIGQPSKCPLHDPPKPLNRAGPTTISSKGRSPTLSKHNLSWFNSLLFLLQLFCGSLRRRTRSRAYRGAQIGRRPRTGGASTESLPGR